MHVSILDPGLQSRTGHHFDLNLRLTRALETLGHHVRWYGHVRPDEDLVRACSAERIELRNTFRIATYAGPKRSETAWNDHQRIEAATAEDLQAVAKSDLWYWPTLTSSQFAAGVAHADAPLQLGGLWWTPRFPHEVGARGWARTVKALERTSRRFEVGAYDDEIVRAVRTFTPDLELHKLPCPHDGTATQRAGDEPRKIGFFGHQRRERGADLLPRLVDALLRRGFQVVVQDSSGSIKNPKSHPRLHVLHFIDHFATELVQCDLVIWPSRPEAYQQNFSGVVSECVASGVPVIVPSGCVPAGVVARMGCSNYFHEYTTGGILEALDEVTANFPEVKARARRAAKQWHQTNGTAMLATWIDERFGGAR